MKTARQQNQQLPENPNPFNIGTPAYGEDFFDREDILEEVRLFLGRSHEYNLLLYGQRRIGKTSLLKKIQTSLIGGASGIFFSLQDQGKAKMEDLLYELASKMLLESGRELPLLKEDFRKPRYFEKNFLPEFLTKTGKPLVLLFDEFDVIGSLADIEGDLTVENFAYNRFIPFISELIEYLRDQNLPVKLIFAVGRSYKDLSQERYGRITKFGTQLEVSYFSEKHTKQLLTGLSGSILPFNEAAMERIFRLTSGQPYFTQCLAGTAFDYARQKEMETITPEVVDQQLIPSIKKISGGVFWLWHGFSPKEKILLYLTARLEEEKKDVTVDSLKEKASRLNWMAAIENHQELLNGLQRLRVIKLTDNKISIVVPFVSRWIAMENTESEMARLLEQIDDEMPLLLTNGRFYLNKKKYKTAADYFKQALEKNPSHFESLFSLGQIYKNMENENRENLYTALDYYEQAYAVNPGKMKEEYGNLLTDALEQRGIENKKSGYWSGKFAPAVPLEKTVLEKTARLLILKKIPLKGFYFIENLEELDLSSGGLEEVPEELLMFPELKKLDMRDNSITFIPGFLKSLKKLSKPLTSGNPIEQQGLSHFKKKDYRLILKHQIKRFINRYTRLEKKQFVIRAVIFWSIFAMTAVAITFLFQFGELTLYPNSFSPNSLTVKGVVINAETGLPIKNAEVSIAGTTVITAPNGKLTASIKIINPGLPVTITAKKAGFLTLKKDFKISELRDPLVLNLIAESVETSFFLSGYVIDDMNNTPIHAAEVFSPDEEITSITDERGMFRLNIMPTDQSDITLRIQKTGFEEWQGTIKKETFEKIIEIRLMPKLRILIPDFIIHDDRLKSKGYEKKIPGIIKNSFTGKRGIELIARKEDLEALLKEFDSFKEIDDIFNPESIDVTGKIVKADYIIMGELFQQAGQMKISARILNVKKGTLAPDIHSFLVEEKDLDSSVHYISEALLATLSEVKIIDIQQTNTPGQLIVEGKGFYLPDDWSLWISVVPFGTSLHYPQSKAVFEKNKWATADVYLGEADRLSYFILTLLVDPSTHEEFLDYKKRGILEGIRIPPGARICDTKEIRKKGNFIEFLPD